MTRMGRFLDLCTEHGVSPRESSPISADEDAYVYVREDDPLPLGRFAVVTAAGEYFYVKAGYDELADAQRAAEANMDDTIYVEAPVAVVDLVTGQAWSPLEVTWREA